VLTSQSIPHLELAEDGFFRLLVDEHWAATAAEELRRYEEENRGFLPPRRLPAAAPFARAGTALIGLVLVLVFLAQQGSALGRDWTSAGDARASAIRAGELWRAATALTLHTDVPHLLSNLVFGALFGYLALHALGGGIGALALLAAGALGNVINSWVHAGEHLSVGASTAVFGAVGLLAGSEARVRHLLREARARRFAPLFAAFVLLLYLGVGEARSAHEVDVLAHCFGLLAGLGLGALLASLPRAAIEHRGVQLACGAAAAGLLALAWTAALS